MYSSYKYVNKWRKLWPLGETNVLLLIKVFVARFSKAITFALHWLFWPNMRLNTSFGTHCIKEIIEAIQGKTKTFGSMYMESFNNGHYTLYSQQCHSRIWQYHHGSLQ